MSTSGLTLICRIFGFFFSNSQESLLFGMEKNIEKNLIKEQKITKANLKYKLFQKLKYMTYNIKLRENFAILHKFGENFATP